ncbi:ABC transporter substrate-binding protein [Jejudonia soesokkakensis]|uniref:ABC transporter substrate-binding protein n=1 Tax=Jejudonia soesokkakensis TaxID=1323432 RepID=A0ABW2MTU6_9FLAO
MEVIDQLGRKLHFDTIPKRIVSLVPSQTELLVDLGLEDRIIGITKFCVHPLHLRKTKAIVGGTKQVHFNKIAELEPEIIICNKEENTEEMVIELQKIAPVWVSEIIDIKSNNEMITQLGRLFSVSEKASEIIKSINNELKTFRQFIDTKAVRKVAYLIWKNPYMAAGRNTFIDFLLKQNKYENIFQQKESRYPEILMDELKDAEVILLSSEPFPFKDKNVFEIKNTLNNDVEVRLVDGEYFSWYGSRLKNAFSYFKELH